MVSSSEEEAAFSLPPGLVVVREELLVEGVSVSEAAVDMTLVLDVGAAELMTVLPAGRWARGNGWFVFLDNLWFSPVDPAVEELPALLKSLDHLRLLPVLVAPDTVVGVSLLADSLLSTESGLLALVEFSIRADLDSTSVAQPSVVVDSSSLRFGAP